MDSGSKETNYSTMSVPAPVGVTQLHNHFKEKYELDDGEAETLVVSSSRSLIDFITAAESMLDNSGQGVTSEKLEALVHRGSGMFLVMGQEEWALYVTALNVNDPNTVYDSIQKIVDYVRQGFSNIIIMC